MERVELTTENIIDANVEKLAELFPEVVTEVRESDGTLRHTIDVEALKARVGDVAEGQRERYQFTWPGKREAKQEAYRQVDKCLRPCPEESVDWDTTQNLYIEGDNLDALKLLRNTYAGKVKMIYIDPPYNTRDDLIYQDDFALSPEEYAQISSEYDEAGGRLVVNRETNGRFHSDWCSMMYPRLLLARDFLTDDGALFISIDENEVENLRKIVDEIFGQGNLVAEFVWAAGRKNDSKYVSVSHEYIICYVRSLTTLKDQGVTWRERKSGIDEIYSEYERLRKECGSDNRAVATGLKAWYRSLPANDPAKNHSHYCEVDDRGIFFPGDISWPGGGGPRYEVLHPVTRKPVTIPSRGWLFSEKRMQEVISEGLVQFGEDETKVPCFKRYLRDHEYSAPYSVFYQDGRAASKRLARLMDGEVFSNPKDETILSRLISMMSDGGDIVMDFFSGSGSFAHAMWLSNLEDQSSRRFILVQIPEDLDANLARTTKKSAEKTIKNAIALCEEIGSPHFVSSVGKERIRRAGKKIAEEIAEENRQPKLGEEPKKVPDIGFRVLKIDSSNFEDVSAEPAEYTQQTLAGLADNLKPGRTAEDLLFQVMPQFQIPLSAKIEKRDINGSSVFSVDDGRLVACFDRNVATETIVAMAKLQPDYAVMRDASFTGDDAVSNFGELFKTYSPATITKVV